MRKFSTRNMLIFVIGLVLAIVLIGLGTAYVIQLKQRILPRNSNNAHTNPGGLKLVCGIRDREIALDPPLQL
jgi:hypothetical protein